MIIEQIPEDLRILCYAELSLAIVGLITNTIQVYIITVKKKKFIFQYLLRSLSVADILTCLVSALSVVVLFFDSNQYWWLFYFSAEVFFMMSGISVIHVISLTWDRFIAVLYPLRHRRMLTKKRVKRFLLTLWCLYIVVAATDFYLYFSRLHYKLLKHLLHILICSSGFSYIVVYGSIAVKILRTNRTPHRHTGTKKSRRTLIVCFLTSVLLLFTQVVSLNISMDNLWFFIILSLNTITNSLVYFGFMELNRWCCKSTQHRSGSSSN